MFVYKRLAFNCYIINNALSKYIVNNASHLVNDSFYKHMQRGYKASTYNNFFLNIRSISTSSKQNTEIKKLYYGLLTPQIKAVKIISLTTSIGGIVAQPILLQQLTKMGGGLPVIIGLCSFIGFFTFITPILLHFVTKKYITHLDYNPDNKKYIATILTFFCRQKKIEFSVEDVKVPDIPGMFTSFHIKGQPFFVDPNLFTDPSHYGKLMGYDKPIDYKLYSTEDSKKNT